MVMLKLEAIIDQIDGGFGGQYYRHDVCGQHAQVMPRAVRKQPSEKQLKVRNAFVAAANLFWQVLTPLQRYAWDIVARRMVKPNAKGYNKPLTGYTLFQMINIIRIGNGLDPILDPYDIEEKYFSE